MHAQVEEAKQAKSLADAEVRLSRLARPPSWNRLAGEGDKGGGPGGTAIAAPAGTGPPAGERMRKQLQDAEEARKQLEAEVAGLRQLAALQENEALADGQLSPSLSTTLKRGVPGGTAGTTQVYTNVAKVKQALPKRPMSFGSNREEYFTSM